MPKKLLKNRVSPARPTRKDYKASLQQSNAKFKFTAPPLKILAGVILVAALFGITSDLGHEVFGSAMTKLSLSGAPNPDKTDKSETLIGKRDVQALVDSRSFVNLKDKSFDVVVDGLRYRVDTSLDIALQQFLLKNLNLSTSRYIGIVGMDPVTGKILSMVGYDKNSLSSNPCVDSSFPAASIFKIITASAVVEKCGFNLDSELTYNGRRYTLYKFQLKNHSNRYTNRITFQDSFAQSVNPVFGKIGAHYLGKTTLADYASAFGFNQSIDFEIRLAPSRVSLSDDPYQWAEVASGFNRETKISPLHGALITSAILNRGRLVEPTIVDQIIDQNGRILYRGQRITIKQALTPEASRTVNHLMETTISSGTCKKAFRGLEKDQILSKLNIGGKTGSIYNKSGDARYDWFVGFAEEKQGPAKIVISAVVAHEKYIGTRASQYARMAMKHYFRSYFAKVQRDL
jgi:cell division protein FtsI/penicillin-binding protein 2